MLYEKVFKELHKQKVQYLVIGGIAVNLHGLARPTADLDLMISFSELNVDKFLEVVNRLGFKPRLPVKVEELKDESKRLKWIKEKGMKVFTLYNPKMLAEQVDVMVQPDLDFKQAYKNKELYSLGNVKIKVGSIKDLIKMKQIAGRVRDLRDIEGLKEIENIKKKKKKKN